MSGGSFSVELGAPAPAADRQALGAFDGLGDLVRHTYVCVHPGARLASRRWYPERFAIVADSLAARGLRVVLTGTAAEAVAARRVAELMAATPVDLVGKTTFAALTALIDGARLVVTNDTGVRHVAAARRTPCVAVACGTDVCLAAHAPTERLLFADVACRPCAHARCPVGHACAHGVESREVLTAAGELLALESRVSEFPTFAA
jgi:ADP-heptose:LPS heptosyltransferase